MQSFGTLQMGDFYEKNSFNSGIRAESWKSFEHGHIKK